MRSSEQRNFLKLIDTLSCDAAVPGLAREAAAILRDLEHHQAELEAQNEELKEAQHHLDELLASYAELYDYAPVAYCTIDRSGHIRQANLRAAALFKLPPTAVTGHYLPVLIAKAQRADFHSQLNKSFTNDACALIETIIQTPGAAPIMVQAASTPYFDRRAGDRLSRIAFTDVTLLKRSETKLQILADVSGVLGRSFDYEANLVEALRALQPTFADIVWINLADSGRRLVVPGTQVTDHRQGPQAAVMSSGEPVAIGSRLLCAPLVSRGGVLGAITCATTQSGRTFSPSDLDFVRDVAQRCAMSVDNGLLLERANRATQARQDVLSVVSHDLKNPLNIIMLGACSLLGATPANERRRGRSTLDSMRRAAVRMDHLINDLLDLSSIDAGRLSVVLHDVELNDLLDDAFESAATVAEDKGVALRVLPSPRGVAVRCDRYRVLQALANILGNAVKFTPAGGHVLLSAVCERDTVCLKVQDSGPGISADDLPQVFKRHWQAPGTAALGRGLGLFIAKGIIDAHGGRISVESTEGDGTSFSIVLPRGAALDMRISPHVDLLARSGQVPVAALRRILIVDDDESIRRLTTTILSEQGFEVMAAEHGRAALELLQTRRPYPELILMDLEMPVLDGFGFVAAKESDPALSAIPVVLCSAQPDLPNLARQLHAAAYLGKPLQQRHLLEIVRRVTNH